MRPLLVLALPLALPSLARASGPVGLVGFARAPLTSQTADDGSKIDLGPLTGVHVMLGWEFGETWNTQLTGVFAQAGGAARSSNSSADVDFSLRMLGLGAQLTYEFGDRHAGLSPYVGAGMWFGNADIHVTAKQGGFTALQDGTAKTLELHLTGGVRYTLDGGIAIRGEVLYSTFGGFLGTLVPQVGFAYTL